MGWDVVAVFAVGVLLGTLFGFFLCLRFAYKLFSKIGHALAEADAKQRKNAQDAAKESHDGYVFYYPGSEGGSGESH